jgi:hypothetical protein
VQLVEVGVVERRRPAAALQLRPAGEGVRGRTGQERAANGEQRVDVGQGAVLKTGVGDIIVLLGGSSLEVSAEGSAPLPDAVMVSPARAAAVRLP